MEYLTDISSELKNLKHKGKNYDEQLISQNTTHFCLFTQDGKYLCSGKILYFIYKHVALIKGTQISASLVYNM